MGRAQTAILPPPRNKLRQAQPGAGSGLHRFLLPALRRQTQRQLLGEKQTRARRLGPDRFALAAKRKKRTQGISQGSAPLEAARQLVEAEAARGLAEAVGALSIEAGTARP